LCHSESEILSRSLEPSEKVDDANSNGDCRWLDSSKSSWQRARIRSVVKSLISGEKVHYVASEGSSFYRFVTLLFLLVPKIKIESQGLSFANTWERSEGCSRRHQNPNRSWLPVLLGGVENSLRQVCYMRGILFWRGQCWFRRIIE
jgi:hypothetical protein